MKMTHISKTITKNMKNSNENGFSLLRAVNRHTFYSTFLRFSTSLMKLFLLDVWLKAVLENILVGGSTRSTLDVFLVLIGSQCGEKCRNRYLWKSNDDKWCVQFWWFGQQVQKQQQKRRNKSRQSSPAHRLGGSWPGCPVGCAGAPPQCGSAAGVAWAERPPLRAAAFPPDSPILSELQRTRTQMGRKGHL